MGKEGGYARFSSENQDKNTIEVQYRAIRDAALRNGDEVPPEFAYSDEATSGVSGDRKHFLEMMADLKSGKVKFSKLYIFSFSRFMRDKFEAAYYKKKLKRLGVQVISASEPLPADGKTADLMEGILDGINEYQSKVIGELSLEGSKNIARAGYWTGGTAPYGYCPIRVPNSEGHMRNGVLVERTRLAVEPSEAQWVRRMFELAATTGWGGHRIYQELCIEAGGLILGRKGRPLGGGGVNAILRNPLYKGDVVYNDYGYERISDLEKRI